VQIIGEIFIGLLQMTVLPYILVALIAGIGKLSYREMRLMAVQGGRFVLLFWGISLAIVVAFTATGNRPRSSAAAWSRAASPQTW
jgi:Na+/H+-dicarboxylate symporter